MSLTNYRCVAEAGLIISINPIVSGLAGKMVLIQPETKKFIPRINDYVFEVLPAGEFDYRILNGYNPIIIASKFLRPVSIQAKAIFESLKKPN